MSLARHNPRRDSTEKQIVAALREAGASVYQISARGVPDLLCFWRQRAFLVECKSRPSGRGPATNLSIAQREFHLRARQEGWPVFIATGSDDVLQIINTVDRHAQTSQRHHSAARARPAPPAEVG